MPTRDEYDAYFEPLIGVELNSFERMEKSQNEYEKSRNQGMQLSSDVPLEQKARAEAMVAEMRRQQKPLIKKLSLQVLENQTKGVPMKTPTFDGKEVPISDLSYVLAESLQHLYSSEDPKAEYYDWVEAQRQIEIDINTNGTTKDEIKARNSFIGFLDDRETELKLIISLYATAERNGTGYYKEMAQNKLSFLQFKLSELRRLRDRTQATKSKSDEQERAEKEMAQAAGMVLGGIALASAEEQALGRYVQNQEIGNEFDSAVEGVMTSYRPVTYSREDVFRKQEILLKNRRKFIEGLRMGKSAEQQDLEVKRQTVRRAKSFSLSRYNQLEREYSRSA